MILIGLFPSPVVRLALQGRPCVSKEYQQIWDTLKIVRVVLKYKTAREQLAKLANELRLKHRLYTTHHSILSRGQFSCAYSAKLPYT